MHALNASRMQVLWAIACKSLRPEVHHPNKTRQRVCVCVLTHLRSLPLDLLLWIGIFWHANGYLLRWEGWVGEQFPRLEALLQELPEVLIFEFDGVPNRTQRRFSVSLHAVCECAVKSHQNESR